MEFALSDKHLKKYPHFDQLISATELQAIVSDPKRVAENAFLPFIQYTKSYQPFRDVSERPKRKERLIRYASRRDSVIFAAYRSILAEPYERQLSALEIADVPTAYRKIPLTEGPAGGKCNIDFANDLFREIQKHDQCTVVALDIRKYFESIDHSRLYRVWCDLLGEERLPRDHLAVFKAITRYHYVDRTEVYERLGYIGPKPQSNGTVAPGYLVPFDKMPKQLCTPQVFKAKIAGGQGEYPSLVRKNREPHGIPQGAPVSDLLANAYLLEFDIEAHRYARALGGRYWRYSDDLVLVLPGGSDVGVAAATDLSRSIESFGEAIEIKPSKTSIGTFTANEYGFHDYTHVAGEGGTDGIQYLGFRFDGRRVFVRNSTMSNFYRKVTRRARRQAIKHVARFEGQTREWLLEKFDFQAFEKRFGRVRDFESVASRKGWTFWTYARRAAERFGDLGGPILKQVSGYRSYIRRAVSDEFDRQLSRRGPA